MASIVCPKLGIVAPRPGLCHQPELHPQTTQKSMQAVGYGFADNPGFGFRGLIKKPHALATDVSFKDPKVNCSHWFFFIAYSFLGV